MSRQYGGRSQIDRKVNVSGELFTLTYGALVAQIVKDYEVDEEINKQLDKMGYNIGVRLVEDFLARFPEIGRCHDLRTTADIVAKQGFKTFLGIVPTVANWNAKGDEFSLILENNPLCDFVELPEDHPNLLYSNIVCGVLRGALEMHSLTSDRPGKIHSLILSRGEWYMNAFKRLLSTGILVQLDVEVWFVQDTLKGDDTTEIRVKFKKKLEDAVPPGED